MKKLVKVIIGLAITFIILYFLLKDIPFNEFSNLLSFINMQIVLLLFVIYLSMNIVRAVRIKNIFKKVKLKKLINIVFIHNMINNILPFRIGEFSYIYMIKKEQGTDHAVSSLFMLRLFDLVAVFIIFAFALLFVEWNKTVFYLFGLFALMLIVIVTILLIFKKFDFIKIKFVKQVRKLIQQYDYKRMAMLLLNSLIIWILSFLFYYMFINFIGIKMTFFQVSVACILIILSTILPVSGIAGFGTTELAWTIGLMIFGIEKNLAIMSGLLIHLIKMGIFVIIGLFGLASRYYSSKTV